MSRRLHTLRLTDSELELLIEDMSGALGVGAENEDPAWRTIYEKAIRAQQRAAASQPPGAATPNGGE